MVRIIMSSDSLLNAELIEQLKVSKASETELIEKLKDMDEEKQQLILCMTKVTASLIESSASATK